MSNQTVHQTTTYLLRPTRYVYPHAATTINGVSLTCDYNGNLTHCVSK